jgi:hypothetical protein
MESNSSKERAKLGQKPHVLESDSELSSQFTTDQFSPGEQISIDAQVAAQVARQLMSIG